MLSLFCVNKNYHHIIPTILCLYGFICVDMRKDMLANVKGAVAESVKIHGELGPFPIKSVSRVGCPSTYHVR